jgi:antitoxin component of MazEF toxin-antitoxin module
MSSSHTYSRRRSILLASSTPTIGLILNDYEYLLCLLLKYLVVGAVDLSEKAPKSEEVNKEAKIDVSKLVAIIPPASEIMGKKKGYGVPEKRVRIRFDRELDKPVARIPSSIAQLIAVKSGDVVEVVVSGKKKAVFTAEVYEAKPGEEVVYVHPADLEKQGVADNSVATIRKVKRS